MKHSKNSFLSLSVFTLSLALSFGASADMYTSNYGVQISTLNTDTTKIVNPKTGEVEYKYTVDDIEITLTKKDYVKAKNWNLEPQDWAKYKYIMEYTPRGLWTPDIDPPIALSVESVNKVDKIKFAKLANEMERDRQLRELDSTIFAIHDVEEKLGGAKLNAERAPKNEIEAKLGLNMQGAVNLFVEPNICKNQPNNSLKQQCDMFMVLAISSTPSSYALTVYHKEGTKEDVLRTLEDSGITDVDIERKKIEIKSSKKMFDKYQTEDLELPFWISQDDKSTKQKSAF